MNKFLTKIIGASLAIAMMIGVGAATGAKDYKGVYATTAPVSFSNIGNSKTGENKDQNISTTEVTTPTEFYYGNNYTFKYCKGKRQNEAILLTQKAGYIFNVTAMPDNIASVNVATASGAAAGAKYGVAFSSTAYTSFTTNNSGTVNISNGKNHTFDCSTENAKYFCVYVDSSTSKNGQVKDLVVTFVSSGEEPPVTETCNITFNYLNGDDPTVVTVNKNSMISTKMPADPTKVTDTTNQIKYSFGGWYKSDDPDNISYIDDNKVTSATVVTTDMNVYAKWDATNYYIISFVTNGGTPVDSVEVDQGKRIAMPNSTRDGYNIEGWYTTETFDANTKVDFTKDTFTKNTTLYAKWEAIAIQEPGHFVKVTNTADIVDGGKYLITYESGETLRAFDGNNDTLDSVSNYVSAEHVDSTLIKKDNNTASAYFTITSADGDYKYIKSASGSYIGRNATSNGLNASTKAAAEYQNTISFDESGNVVITGKGGCIIKYNSTSGQNRFRYFTANSTMQPVQLYRFVSAYETINNSLTKTQLSYRYTGNALDGFEYSDISIRFGANITKALWNELDTNEHVISGFGVIIADGDFVTNDDDMADAIEDVVSSTVTTTFTQQVYAIDYFVPVANMASTIGEDANNYFWNLRFNIAASDMDKMYTAAAYIKVGSEYVLMKVANESVETLALDYLTSRGCDETTAEGSLQAIVDNA